MLALSIRFFLYRAALLAMPGEYYVGMAPASICAEVNVPRPLFDAFTGLPDGVVVTCRNSDGQAAVMESIPMSAYWLRSVLFGFAGGALALIVLWWGGRRRLRGLQRRSHVPTSA